MHVLVDYLVESHISSGVVLKVKMDGKAKCMFW